jgi:signal transduction histidine kinase
MLILVNILSASIQGTPTEVWAFYTIGLVLNSYLSIRLAAHSREAVQLANAAQQRADEAEQTRQTLERFTHMVAHDLRNSLTALVGCAELLRGQYVSLSAAQQHDALGLIASAAQRLERLVGDLSDATAVSSGHFAVHPETADVVAIARDVVGLQRTAHPDRQIGIAGPDRLNGRWDRARIAQVVGNLVSNALKYSPAGSPVQVAISRTDTQAVLRVVDAGCGIATDQVSHLFRPFVRLADGRSAPGTGLGLFIAQGIVAAHEGRIEVESEIGRGSTVSLILPLARESAES